MTVLRVNGQRTTRGRDKKGIVVWIYNEGRDSEWG